MTDKPGSIPLRERLTLAEEWEALARDAIPAAASPTQRREMRRAFYAGAVAMFGLLTGGLDPDGEPTDLDVEYVESLHQELARFSADVGAGRA